VNHRAAFGPDIDHSARARTAAGITGWQRKQQARRCEVACRCRAAGGKPAPRLPPQEQPTPSLPLPLGTVCLVTPSGSPALRGPREKQPSSQRLLAAAVMATSGLAGEIRSSGESNDLRDPFDLAGYNQARLTELANDAFGDPVPARAMVRFSFLVGGGKKDRQKYDPACPKHMAAALRELGFEEDRGASEDLACQGSFKHQHDTDKNTMTMHVFPRVKIIEDEDAGAAGEGALDWKRLPPEYLSTVCSLPVFKGLVAQKTPSWSQRKRLLEALKEMGTQFTELEQKLINMEPMSPDEQRLYESSSTDNLAEKVEWLQVRL
jgi:hypothetical protein